MRELLSACLRVIAPLPSVSLPALSPLCAASSNAPRTTCSSPTSRCTPRSARPVVVRTRCEHRRPTDRVASQQQLGLSRVYAGPTYQPRPSASAARAASLDALHELIKLAPVAVTAEALGYSPRRNREPRHRRSHRVRRLHRSGPKRLRTVEDGRKSPISMQASRRFDSSYFNASRRQLQIFAFDVCGKLARAPLCQNDDGEL